jgi:hypothetical protein
MPPPLLYELTLFLMLSKLQTLFSDPERRISGENRRAASDHAQQPQNQDQDQKSAKTDIHVALLCFILPASNRRRPPAVPNVTKALRLLFWQCRVRTTDAGCPRCAGRTLAIPP